PYLVQPPVSMVALQGVTTNFSAQASGTAPIEYYWFRRNFGSPATTNFLGTGPTLTFAPLTRADGQANYFVVASNLWGSTTSSLRSVTVQFPTAITNITATNIIAELNEFISFSVQYEAQPNPTVRWYKDGVLQPELFSPFMNFTSVQASNAGTYQLVLSNFINSVTSAPIVLTVKEPRGPSIVQEPPATTVLSTSGSINLGFTADGTPKMYYRWFMEDGTPVSNWTTFDSLFISPISTDHSGNYYAIVTNGYGSATTMLASVTVMVPQPAAFQNKKFVKIADSLTTVPGLSPLKFTSFRDAFIRNREVWFGATGGGAQFSAGVYHWSNNTLESLVNTNTLVPGSSSRFTNFYGSTFVSDGKVIFGGYGSGDEHGLYAWTNQTVIKLYDKNTVVPGRNETFGRFGWPTVHGNQFAFLGFSIADTNIGWQYRGVFVSSNGVLTTLADTNNTLPGLGGHFVGSSSQVGFDGNKVAWWAWNEETKGGIFSVTRALTLKNIADELTINPATGQTFDGFISPPNVVTGRVYFVGHDIDFNTSLFYGDGNGPIQTIAKPGDIVPGRGMTFDSIAYPAQSGSTAGNFFDGNASGNYSGIFFWNGSDTVKVIDELDSLDGKAISFVYVADAEGTDLLFYVSFANGQEALYAMIPDSAATFDQWANAFTFPAGQSDPEDDADGDGIKNAFEYYFGSNPTSAVSGAMPTGSSVNVGGQNYPAITFIRSKNTGGVTLIPQASSNVNFSQLFGTVVDSVVDLGNGTERVTIRSTVNSATQATQFLRIQLSIP
ncbi:MAG TPA: immunoglobulin domain-containing protein, partial [Verrucomicrobiae bacterium]